MLRSTPKSYLVGEEKRSKGAAEAYKALKTNIEFSSQHSDIKTIMIASSIKGEGKSITAANLSISYALSNKKVLLIDANLRHPSQHKIFNVPNSLGLSALLSDRCEPKDAIINLSAYNIGLIPGGQILPNPPEALASHRMTALLGELKESFEVIILDTSPILSVADAQIIAARCDGVLLVVKAGEASRESLIKAKEKLSLVGARFIGAVMNNSNSRNSQYYSSY
ncbi:CpsD/CapB family tyrosine-protein kinase [Cohnella lupini]|uniref:non-specific protein-tyrosine kinase n=1 Tax=Cohnella lupini TaxID=1294267 RepID=A0A3D9IU93_9BACL|nr:CpsD/CapB family tyrosine-protein kinase [Cohnella lupini]RED65079.1 capsular exopolysaccharide synthesis family protein [Cohnella lupini]